MYQQADVNPDVFWMRVMKTPTCWLYCKINGEPYDEYGRVCVKGVRELAHRVSWRLEHNASPLGLVLHHCDNRTCVRPSHLYVGTFTDNARDRENRGRGNHAFGERNGVHTKPERRPYGDRNGSRLHPERLNPPMGDKNGARLHPERVPRGDNHYKRRQMKSV